VSAHVHHYDSLPPVPAFKAPILGLGGLAAGGLGVLVFFVTLLASGAEQAFVGLLQAMLIPTFIGLAALFYIAVHSITGAVWMQPLRRLMEGLSAGLPIGAGLFLFIALFGSGYLYDWVALGGEDHRALFHVHGGSKGSFMVWWRYLVTNAAWFALWIFLQRKLVGLSLAQDQGEDIAKAHHKWSIIYLIGFAPTFTFFVWDSLLALHINWFSTMWGVYCFASAVQVFLCVLCLLIVWMRAGPLKQHINELAVHDVGTWMVAWSCFCAYIGFSQYLLIYYANLDEETYWYVMRTQNGYGWVLIFDALLRWPLPFLGLMSQRVRTKPWALVLIASAVLVGNWLDWSWIIMPAFEINSFRSPFSIPELLMGLGAAGGLLWASIRFWQRHGLLPVGEPTLLASINAEHRH
jgi:hypothetical protein